MILRNEGVLFNLKASLWSCQLLDQTCQTDESDLHSSVLGTPHVGNGSEDMDVGKVIRGNLEELRWVHEAVSLVEHDPLASRFAQESFRILEDAARVEARNHSTPHPAMSGSTPSSPLDVPQRARRYSALAKLARSGVPRTLAGTYDSALAYSATICKDDLEPFSRVPVVTDYVWL